MANNFRGYFFFAAHCIINYDYYRHTDVMCKCTGEHCIPHFSYLSASWFFYRYVVYAYSLPPRHMHMSATVVDFADRIAVLV